MLLGTWLPRGARGTAAYDPELGMESARLFGNINRYAYYFVDLEIGSPSPQRTSVIVDTGSRLVGFPCRGCAHCGEHIDPAFDVSRSLSAQWTDCDSSCRSNCLDGRCQYTESYSEGSSLSGSWFSDMVSVGNAVNSNPPVRAQLGCHTMENRLFYTQRANGIMGLAPMQDSNSGPPTILQDLFHDKKHVDTRLFSMCLATWGGMLTVGGYNRSSHTGQGRRHGGVFGDPSGVANDDGIQWVRMRALQYYFIFPDSVYIESAGSRIPAVTGGHGAFGVTIVDSGTTFTYFPSPVYRALVDSLNRYCSEHDGCAAKRASEECFLLENFAKEPTGFPALEIMFSGGAHVRWAADGYLHDRGDVWCLTFKENRMFQTVLGISWMIHRDIIFDLAHSRLGVAEADCPEHRVAEPTPLPTFAAEAAFLVDELSQAGVAIRKALGVKGQDSLDSAGRDGRRAGSAMCLSAVLVFLGLASVCLAVRPCRAAPEVGDEKEHFCTGGDDVKDEEE